MTPRSIRWLTMYQFAAGACDASTGLLLLFVPAWTLHLINMRVLPVPEQFASFIGVFVLAVGLSYLWLAVAWPLSKANAIRWKTQWEVTGVIRTLVALFLLAEILAGRMETAWIGVALSDALLASAQWTGIAQGWLNDAP